MNEDWDNATMTQEANVEENGVPENSAENEQGSVSANKKPQEDGKKRINFQKEFFINVLNGEKLSFTQIKHYVPFVLMVVVMILLYVNNRYKTQQLMIKIEKLKDEKNEMRYRATARSSQLLQKSRESQVAEFLMNTADSTLKAADNPPYIIYRNKK